MALYSPITNQEIDAENLMSLIEKEDVDVIDVREPHELPEVNEFPNIKIPLAQLPTILRK